MSAASALASADDPEVTSHMAERNRDGRIAVRDVILARRSDIGPPDAETATGFVIDQANAELYARSGAYLKTSARWTMTRASRWCWTKPCLVQSVSYPAALRKL